MQPFVFAALNIAVPRAISAAIIGELLVGGDGIGSLIESSRQSLDTVGVCSGLVVATVVVMTASHVVRSMERRMLMWRPPMNP